MSRFLNKPFYLILSSLGYAIGFGMGVIELSDLSELLFDWKLIVVIDRIEELGMLGLDLFYTMERATDPLAHLFVTRIHGLLTNRKHLINRVVISRALYYLDICDRNLLFIFIRFSHFNSIIVVNLFQFHLIS